MTVVEYRSTISKRLLAYFLIMGGVLVYAFISQVFLANSHEDNRRNIELNQALKSVANRIVGRIAAMASSNDFIDFIRTSHFRDNYSALDLSSLAARSASGRYDGIEIHNKSKPIFVYGQRTNNYITADLCYRSDILDNKLGTCTHTLTVYLSEDYLISLLQQANPDIQSCADCPQINSFPSLPLSEVNITSHLPLRAEMSSSSSSSSSFSPPYAIWLFMFISFVLFSFRLLSKFTSITHKQIEKPLTDNKIDANTICLDQLYMFPRLEDDSNLLRFRAKTDAARDRAIARVIHDSVGSPLSSAGFIVSSLDIPNDIKQALHATIKEATSAAYNCMETLRPETLDSQGLIESIKLLLRRCSSMQVHYEIEISENDVDDPTSLTAYMIVQEAISNALKYSEASELTLTARIYNKNVWQLIIIDNGKGFDSETSRKGRGMINMRARAKSVGGQLTVTSSPGEGTSIKATLPLGVNE